MKEKIIRVSTVPQSIGFFRDVMVLMRDQGFEMVALSSPGRELTALENEDGFKTIAVPMERHISIIKDFKALLKLIIVFKKEKPLIVHSITPKAGLLCMMASCFSKVPIRIHTFTGLVWPTAKGIKRKILMVTDKITCKCATHIIPEGEGVKDDLQRFITHKPMKVLGYGNVQGVDLDRFNPEKYNRKRKDSDFVFLFIGRIVGNKGINELVWAFSRLCEEFFNLRLSLVGNFEPKLDPLNTEILKIIEESKQIEANGPLYGEDLVKAYAHSDCFVMPSYREGFPNTVLEAGAMGLPQIVTDINGSREIIKDGFNGLIIPSRDKDALYNAMKLMLIDHKLRDRLCENARPLIVSRYEKSFVQKCQIDFYKELLEGYSMAR